LLHVLDLRLTLGDAALLDVGAELLDPLEELGELARASRADGQATVVGQRPGIRRRLRRRQDAIVENPVAQLAVLIVGRRRGLRSWLERFEGVVLTDDAILRVVDQADDSSQPP